MVWGKATLYLFQNSNKERALEHTQNTLLLGSSNFEDCIPCIDIEWTEFFPQIQPELCCFFNKQFNMLNSYTIFLHKIITLVFSL